MVPDIPGDRPSELFQHRPFVGNFGAVLDVPPRVPNQRHQLVLVDPIRKRRIQRGDQFPEHRRRGRGHRVYVHRSNYDQLKIVRLGTKNEDIAGARMTEDDMMAVAEGMKRYDAGHDVDDIVRDMTTHQISIWADVIRREIDLIKNEILFRRWTVERTNMATSMRGCGWSA